MKILKNLSAKILILLSILALFASCKKDKEIDSDSFDPTKFYITGEISGRYSSSYYAMIFKPNAQVVYLANGGAVAENAEYAYQNGKLKIFNYYTFDIANNKIINSGIIGNLNTYFLQQIPETDAFAGKNFNGKVIKNGVNDGLSCQIQFTSNRKFILKINGFLQTAATGEDYTLQNNGIATANTGNDGCLHLMSMAGGKLYYSQNHSNQNTNYATILNLQ